MAIQITPISSNNTILTPQEQNLVASKEMIRFFGLPEDFVQLYVYNNLGTLLANNPNFQNYSVTENKEINFDPAFDVEQLGFRLGTYELQYNFLRPLLTQNPNLDLFIKNISADRTEIKVATTTDNDLFFSNAVAYIDLIQNRNYFIEYYIDLGNNNLLPALSMAAEKDIFGNATVTIKLENPLSNTIGVNTPLNVVEKIVNTQTFQAVLTADIVSPTPNVPTLRQANFSLDVDSYRIGSSDYFNYDQILNITPFSQSALVTYFTPNGSNGVTLGYYTPDLLTNSYYNYVSLGGSGNSNLSEVQTLLSFISSSNPTINVDYTDYNSFIHFGSAVQQLETFQYKLNKIQTFQSASDSLPPNDLNYILYQNQINSTIQSFTGYEEYLYYQSSSFAWPKSNNTLPYTNYSTTSSQAITWYNFQQTSASYYDEFNNNNLVYALPQYLQESPTFDNVAPFVHSMGQLFDDVWLYIKAITDLWKADNDLKNGISKDLVGNALQSLGIQLYTDGDQDDLYTWLYGTTPQGSPYFQTASWQTGVTASQYTMPGQDEAKSVFKRIYANLPTLLKSKGTNRFINYLNTLYGTPDTILFPMEFGGVDKSSNTPEYIYNKFTYGLQPASNQYIWVSRDTITPDTNIVQSFEVRFKPENVNQIQTILTSTNHTPLSYPLWGITITGSISGGFDYGRVSLHVKNSSTNNYLTVTTSDLPLFVTGSDGNTNWWNVRLQQTGSDYILSVQNEVQGEVGHTSSVGISTIGLSTLDDLNRSFELGNINQSFNPTIPLEFGSGRYFGQLQEFRGWITTINDSSFNSHTLDPESYIGNTTSSAYDDLLFRFPLGNDLFLLTTTTTGSQPNQTYNRQINFSGVTQNSYVPFTETYYALPAIGGYSTPNTDKIRIVDQVLATTRLQPKKSVVYPPVLPTTMDINLTQTGFSPQDQINNDIIHQLGNTYNLDEIIGDPRDGDLNYYPQLQPLQEEYFQKYISSYNYKDFITLMETFHKSLFRYLADYIPGRSNNATGIVIKPHILERSKVRRYEPTIDTASYDGTIEAVTIEGSNPGNYCCSRNSPLNEAFFDGEFEGSDIQAWSYYDQNNPFTTAICDCHQYQITTDGLVIYRDCNGEIKTNSGAQRVFQVTACSGSFDNLFGSNFYVQDLGRFNKGQAFVEQYEGWDALDNNVSKAIQSQYKFKKLPTSQSIDSTAYNCVRWKVTRNPDFANNQDMFFTYTDCNGTFSCGTVNANFPVNDEPTSIYVVAREDGQPQWSNPAFPIAPCFNATNTPSSWFTSSFDGYVTLRDKRVFNYYSQSIEWQDTNLTNAGYVRSRETGISTTSPAFNQPMIEGSTIGEVPNVEKNQTFIAFSDWAGNTLAERLGSSNFHIKWLVDETGSVYTPEFSSSYFWNTAQNFETYTPVNISIYTGNGNLGENYETTVYRSLKRFETILYTNTGSLDTNTLQSGSYASVNFEINPALVAPPLNLDAGLSTLSSFSNLNPVIFDTVTLDQANSYDNVTGIYTAPYTTNQNIQIEASLRINNGLGPGTFIAKIIKNGTVIKTSTVTSAPVFFNITLSTFERFTIDDEYYITVENDLAPTTSVSPSTTYFRITAVNNSTSIPSNSIFPSTPTPKTLLMSSSLYPYLGSYSQTPKPNSGYSDPISFEIKKYDQIRFLSNEQFVYTIMDINFDNSVNPPNILLTLDREIPVYYVLGIPIAKININDFVIRRLVDDPGFIIINNNPTQEVGKAPSFIIPKYISNTMKNNLPDILATLSSKGLIP